jgi:hypothetical protein
MKAIIPEKMKQSWSNKKSVRLMLIAATILGLTLACSIPGFSQPTEAPEGAVETRVAETMAAATTVEGPTGEETPSPSENPTETLTETPSSTPSPTLSPTATLTATPEIVRVSVSGDTFCRTGPGIIYEGKGILNTDQESEIIARDPTGTFWYITNPDASGNCWIGGRYATPEGPTDSLPVYTPPPTPTPGVELVVDFREMDGCVATWMEFTVDNTGDLPLESFTVTLEDRDSGETFGPRTENAFVTWNGCLDDTDQDSIPTGSTGYFMSAQIDDPSYNPRGEPFQATIKICSQENLGGLCQTRVVNFTAPSP